jgi:hypothetical protein
VLQAGVQNDILASLTRLSDVELVARLKGLVARERDAAAQLIAHRAELDTRDVHLREGYGSLYVYCRDALGLSRWEAYNRIEVARAARRFPVILDMLTKGSVNLTAVRLLAPHLTPSNHREVLESARGKRKPEVEEIVARLSPRPDVAPSVRKLPALRPELTPAPSPAPVAAAPVAAAPVAARPVPSGAAPSATPRPVGPAAMTPLSPDRYKLQLTIGGETLEKLRLAKNMLGHAIPSGDDAAILDRALTTLLRAGEEEVRRHAQAAPIPRDETRGARCLGGGQAQSLGAGPWALCVHRHERPPLRRTRANLFWNKFA